MLKQRVAPLLASVDVLVIPTVPTMYPSPLGIGHIELEDGSWVQGFVCESWALDGAEEISRFGGWRGWLAHR